MNPDKADRQFPRRMMIREAAARIFAARGYHGASVQEVADAVGFNKAGVYYYFKSKEELLSDILGFADAEVGAVLESVHLRQSGHLEKLGALVSGHVTWYLRHPDIAKVAFRDWGELTGEALDLQIERRRRHGRFLRASIERCQVAGLIPIDANTTLIANFINGAVAAANAWFSPAGPDQPEDVGRAYGEMAVSVALTGGRDLATRRLKERQ